MTTPKTVQKNTYFFHASLFTFMTNGIIILCGFAIFFFITKHYGKESFGIWIQLKLTTQLFCPLLLLKLDSASIRFISGISLSQKRAHLRMINSIVLPLAFFFIVSLWAMTMPLSELLFGDSSFQNFIRPTLLITIFETCRRLFVSHIRAQSHVNVASFLDCVAIILRLLTLLLSINKNIPFNLYFQYLAWCECFNMSLAWTLSQEGRLLGHVEFTEIKKYLYYSLPLIPYTFFYWAMTSADRYIITHIFDLSMNASYSAGLTLCQPLILLASPSIFVLFPIASELWNQNKQSEVSALFHISSKAYLIFGSCYAFLLILFSKDILGLLPNTHFANTIQILPMIALSALFLGLFQIHVFVMHLLKKTKELIVMSFAGTCFNIILNLIFLPRYGIVSTAIISFVTHGLLYLWLLAKTYQDITPKLPFPFMVKLAIILVLSFIIYCFSINYIKNAFIHLCIMALVLAVFLWIFRLITLRDIRFLLKLKH